MSLGVLTCEGGGLNLENSVYVYFRFICGICSRGSGVLRSRGLCFW